jgi:hypothetical protein
MSFSKIDPDSFHTRRVSSTHVAIRFLIKVAEKWWLSIIVYGTRAAKADTLHYSSPAEFDTEKKPITFPPLVSGQEIHYSRAWTWTHDVDADLAHPYHQCPMWMHPIRIPRFRPFRIQPLAAVAAAAAVAAVAAAAAAALAIAAAALWAVPVPSHGSWIVSHRSHQRKQCLDSPYILSHGWGRKHHPRTQAQICFQTFRASLKRAVKHKKLETLFAVPFLP